MFRLGSFGGVLGAALVAASLLGTAGRATAKHPEPPPVTTVVSFNPALGELPESMTADSHGNLYVSLINGSVRRIGPDHAVTQVATVPLPAGGLLTGIKVGPDGRVYVASASFAPDPAAAFIWRISPGSGAVDLFATLAPEGFPNDLAFDDDGNLLVTDPFLGLIYEIDSSGHPSVFLQDPLLEGSPTSPAFAVHLFGVDGIAFDGNKRSLFVANVDFGRIMEIELDRHHGPEIEVLVEDPALKGVDGIAIDRRGTIYAAVNTQDRIATVDKHGNIAVLVEGHPPFDGPSSFAFGTGHADKKTLYVANFAIGRFLGGLPASPGVVSLPVPVPGLTLP